MRSLFSVMGNSQKLDGGAMFGNAPKAVWQRWANVDEANRIDLCCRALLVKDGGRNILFETGIGAFFEPKLRERYGVVESEHVLLNSLAELGLTPANIDVVVLSHLHFDHAGGVLAAWQEGVAPTLVFTNAHYVVGAEAFARAQKPHARDKASFIAGLPELLFATGKLELINGEHSQVLGEGYRFIRSDGHTPGMMLTEVSMPDGPVLFCADLIPGTPWVHVPITMGYDRYPELLIDEKQRLFEHLLVQRGRLFFTHDPATALARLGQDGGGRFVALEPAAKIISLNA